MSMLSRIYHDVKNSLSDAYGHFMLGDDTGKGATFACIFRPRRMTTDSINNSVVSKFDLGMTFCEVNERAYVRTVDPESEAALAGVRPRDCVQLALVLAGGKLEALQEDDRRAVSHALECESGGSRTSYDEMRVLFERCSLTPRSSSTGSTDKVSDSIFENSSVSSEEGRKTGYFSSNVTKTTQRILSRYTPTQAHEQMDGGWMPSSLDDEALYPVVLVFRRTRKRIPGLSPINVPTFRLDDECERAANLIRRLAPTVDTEFQPDAWDEIMDNAKGYFKAMTDTSGDVSNKNIKDSRSLSKVPGYSSLTTAPKEAQTFEDEIIPLDPIEEKTVQLMESLKNKMKADLDNRRNDGGDNDVEAETIRGMVQQALGLAFIRTSKVVLGVSVHAGTGIVIARLPDGTWSAPSAIGAYGLGLGIQFGVETVDYIFVIQKQEALEHFLRGGNFTLGGNVGAALAGLGREAYGAASFRDTICLSPADRLEVENPIVENATDVAPIVAYAKAQGLYVGMSVEGQKFFTRDDVNDRIYKFMAGRSVTAREILTGVISTPPEAEDLYAALHSVEFTHEIMRLPRPPRILRDDIKNEWRCDRLTLALNKPDEHGDSPYQYAFFENLSRDDAQEFSIFETKFKSFLYGGVSVQRIIPGSIKPKRERRTLWLMLPEVGSLQLGLVAKSSDDPNECSIISQRVGFDDQSEISYSLKSNQGSDDIMKFEGDDTTIGDNDNLTAGGTRRRLTKVRLSSDHSMALTDITLMKLNPRGSSIPKLEDESEHTKLIYIEEISRRKTMLLLANTAIEAEILLCGLKLLIERETARFGIRGAQPISAFGVLSVQKTTTTNLTNEEQQNSKVETKGKTFSSVPRGPTLTSTSDATNKDNRYEYGMPILYQIEDAALLTIPLPLCRALILDSSSPVIKKWYHDRGDSEYVKSSWEFPVSSSLKSELHSSELKCISSGHMVGGSRTVTFKRTRNGQKVDLSENHTVDVDNPSELSLSVQEKMPRRGFNVQVTVNVSAVSNQSCQVLITADLTPIGRNMADQSAVHKAYLLVIDELKTRYGSGSKGLLHVLLRVTQPPNTQRPNQNVDHVSRLLSNENKPAPRENSAEIVARKQPALHASSSDRNQQPYEPSLYESEMRIDHREYSSETLSSSISGHQRATIVVPQLPRIPLALMPCPREEDESKVDEESFQDYKIRTSRK